MPKDDFFDLGRDPAKINDEGNEDKIIYPCLHGIGPEDFPPMKEMKLGDTAEVIARVRISRHGGFEVTGMKYLGTKNMEMEKDKDTLLKRHKKNSFSTMGGGLEQPVE